MKLEELKDVLYSTHGSVTKGIVYSLNTNKDIEEGVIDYLVKKFGESEVKRIEAFENKVVISIKE